MCNLFNEILTSESFPKNWSTGYIHVVPIYRKGNICDPSNYRGITISSCLGKLFTLLLNNRLQIFLEEHKIISTCQIGFHKNKRTSDHIFVLKSIIEEAKHKKRTNLWLLY